MASVEDTYSVVDRDETFASGRLALYRRTVGPADGQDVWARLALLHGYGDHSGRYVHFYRWLAARGVACHTFDFRGHGRSPGPRGHVRQWEDYLDDLTAFFALDELAPTAAGGPLFLLGHSHGGLVAAAAAVRGVIDESRVAGCVLTSPYFRGLTPVSAPWRAFARVCDWVAPWLRVPTGLGDGTMTSDLAMRAESRQDPFIHRIATPRWYRTTLTVQAEVMARAGECRLPLLCLVAGADGVADPAAAAAFIARAGSTDKRHIDYPAARHELLREIGRDETFAEIDAWIRARVPATPLGRHAAVV